jgi:hypothetical protein
VPVPTNAFGDHACPSPFVFPDGLAAAAGLAIDDLAAEDDATYQALTAAGATIEGPAFQGATADLFWLSYQARLESRGWGALLLTTERQRVADLLAQAAAAEADRNAEIVACVANHP